MSKKRGLSLADIPVGTRIHAITLISIIGLIALALATIYQTKETLVHEAETCVRHLAESATGVIKHFYAEAQAGRLTVEQPQAGALGVISAMRFDDNNYFSVISDKAFCSPMRPSPSRWERAASTTRIPTACTRAD